MKGVGNMNASRFIELLEREGAHKDDLERKALFYILSGNDDLYSKVNHIYDFDEHLIKPECLGVTEEMIANGYEHNDSKEPDFCSSSRALVKLAFNLYNGSPADVLSVFCVLEQENFDLAMDAIRIRLNKGLMVENHSAMA